MLDGDRKIQVRVALTLIPVLSDLMLKLGHFAPSSCLFFVNL